MNNEIKEILEILKKCYDLKDENLDNYISLYQFGLLLDYITKLQEENEKLHKELDYADNYNIYLISRIDKATDYIDKFIPNEYGILLTERQWNYIKQILKENK